VTGDPEDGRWTIIKQRDFFLYRTMWQGSEGVDLDAVPSYPPPGQIVTVDQLSAPSPYRRYLASDDTIWRFSISPAGEPVIVEETDPGDGLYEPVAYTRYRASDNSVWRFGINRGGVPFYINEATL
jgi:hypothetical protein